MVTISDRIGRENNFNLLRMIAATGVLVSHAFPLSLGKDALEPFEVALKGENLGRACVFVFFAVSGFFISSSYANHRNILNFIKARALRILPGLYVMLVGSVALAALIKVDVDNSTFWSAVPGYLLSQATMGFVAFLGVVPSVGSLPGIFSQNPLPNAMNGSLWSLPLEVTCYAGVLCCGLLGVLRPSKLFAALVIVCTAGYIARLVALDQGFKLPYYPQILVYVGFPFIIGMAFFVWSDRVLLSKWIALGLAAVAVLAWPTPVFLLAFVAALSYITFFVGFANLPILSRYNRLGDYSYGAYIYAFPIQQAVAMAGVDDPLINILVAAPLVLACAILSWHIVEKPFLKLKATGLATSTGKAGRAI
jgi:peptidoglycan/LPS O-acetylase OafA/YrhL